MSNDSDYSTTVIYKITCNDPNITDKYVGHTIDFVRRRKEHKNNICNEQSAYCNLKLYKFIRDNGGWDNWKMEVIAFYNCNNLNEARQKEQEHYVELKATLNSVEPFNPKSINADTKDMLTNAYDGLFDNFKHKLPDKPYKFFCEKCDCKCRDKTDWDKHVKTIKHNSDGFQPKFECNLCNYKCAVASLLEKHKLTTKHKTRQIESDKQVKCADVTQSSNDTDIMALVKQLLIQNDELKNTIIEQSIYHKKETAEIFNKIIESIRPTSNNI